MTGFNASLLMIGLQMQPLTFEIATHSCPNNNYQKTVLNQESLNMWHIKVPARQR